VREESYVVRIYRRRRAGGGVVVGVVEAVLTGWQKPFQSLQELADILARPAGRSRRRGSGASDGAADPGGKGEGR
jgi:hypothetical protein